MQTYQLVIIGGGAAGLTAAITAGRHGRNILIIEKNKSLGRKILVTGNGRCNLTNLHISPERYYGENTKCLHNIFNRFSAKETMDFFEKLGVRLKTEPEGRVFPVTNQATTVLDHLLEEVQRLKINVKAGEEVIALKPHPDYWEVTTNKNTYQAKRIILTTGGQSYPQLGSTGNGFTLARKLGHRIIPPRPALVPLELAGNWFHKLQGVKTEVNITLTEKPLVAQKGELLFTHYGISGPVVLDLSRHIIDANHTLIINFFPNDNTAEVGRLLEERQKTFPKRTLVNSLEGLLPKKLCAVLVTELPISQTRLLGEFPKKELHQIAQQLTHWSVTVKQPRPFSESMITAGGVATNEVNPRTMESIIAKGLYLAGEVLDIDGVSGGYNLQFAWSTGYLAGISASASP